MNAYYHKSRIAMMILSVIISLIMFVNEHISFKIAGTVFITLATLITSFLTAPISKKMIQMGDKISKKILRVLYYSLMIPVALIVGLFGIVAIGYISSLILPNHYTDMGKALSDALTVVGVYVVFFLFCIVPYIQSLIVLFFRSRDINTSK